MPFGFRGKEAADIVDSYAKLIFDVFARVYTLVFLVSIFFLVHIYWCLYRQGGGIPRGSAIFPGKGLGGGQYHDRFGGPYLLGGYV